MTIFNNPQSNIHKEIILLLRNIRFTKVNHISDTIELLTYLEIVDIRNLLICFQMMDREGGIRGLQESNIERIEEGNRERRDLEQYSLS